MLCYHYRDAASPDTDFVSQPRRARRWSRRQALIGGASLAAVGATGGAFALARRSGDAEPVNAAAIAPSTPAAPLQTPTPRPAQLRGGVVRLAAPQSFNFDTFDAQRTGEPSVAEVLGRTHSRLVTWTNFDTPLLGGDIAGKWEQPDPNTWTFHLRAQAAWQDRPPLDGRAVTAADVVAHFERTRSLSTDTSLPLVQRAREYASIRRISSPEDGVVVFETSEPDPFLLSTLASRFALIQAPEAVEAFADAWQDTRPEQVVGSGPFVYDGMAGSALRFSAFADGHNVPFLDGIELHGPDGQAALFRGGQLDEALTRDRRDAASLRQDGTPGTVELSRFEDSPVMSGFFTGAPPWNNPALLCAISAALNRTVLAERLFGGRADACGIVSPATPAFALSDGELAKYPGYRSDPAADAADARARWAAAGGTALGNVAVDVPNIFDPLYAAGATVTGLLNEVLGHQFQPSVETYTTISAKTAEKRYGNGKAAFWFGWGPPLADPDPSRYVIETFDSQVDRAVAAGASSRELATRLDVLASEFSLNTRAAIVRELANTLLASAESGLVMWLLQRNEVLRRGRLSAAPPTPFWGQHLNATDSLKQDP